MKFIEISEIFPFLTKGFQSDLRRWVDDFRSGILLFELDRVSPSSTECVDTALGDEVETVLGVNADTDTEIPCRCHILLINSLKLVGDGTKMIRK